MPATAERAARDLELLARASRLFNEDLELDEAVRQVIQALSETLGAYFVLWRPDPAGEFLVPGRQHHPDPAVLERIRTFLAAHPLSIGDSLTGLAFRSQQDLWLPDTAQDERFKPIFRDELGIHSFITATIYSRGEMLGMLSGGRTGDEESFCAADLALLRSVADQAGNAIATSRFLEAEVMLRQRAETLLKIAKTMRSDLSWPLMQQDVVDVTWQFLRSDFVGLFQLDELHRFHLAAASDLELVALAPRWPAADPGSLLGRILHEGTPVHLASLAQEPMLEVERSFLQPDPLTSCQAVPLYGKGLPSGVLVLLRRDARTRPEREDLELIAGIGELITMGLENQRLIQQEASIHAARMLAVEVAREREALIRQIVHDLRNSTQAISLVNEEIEIIARDHPQIQFGVNAIDRQVTFISTFLKEKLSWINQLPADPPAGTPDLYELVQQLLAGRGEACPRHTFTVEAVARGIHLPLPRETLERMLLELLDNACKFTPTGGRVRFWTALSDGWVTCYVADNGPGIPPEHQAQVGEPGFRLRPELPGTGAGLTMVKRLATEAGGLFGFNSRPGEGSTFYVTLPTTRWGRPGA